MKTEIIQNAISDIQAGKMVIITDDKDRENEGDLVMAAEKITPDAINFMAHHGCGLICMPMSEDDFERLDIPMMVQHNQSKFNTPFGVSISAKNGITTGISAYDRAHTIRLAANPKSTAADIVKPGHVFPLKAAKGGVFNRRGQTEASIDLMKLAGLHLCTVICEIMNEDGSMARENDIIAFSKKHKINVISVQDILTYRLQQEKIVEKNTSANFPTEFGMMKIHSYCSHLDENIWIVITSGDYQEDVTPLVRLHSQCLTGESLHSIRCDCGEQLKKSLKFIAKNNGILIYLPQEGRGIGLENKIKAYALQDTGLDTVEANLSLGFRPDEREYFIAAQILKDMQVNNIKLITNNPTKIVELKKYGINVFERVCTPITTRNENACYLKTKKIKMGHLLEC